MGSLSSHREGPQPQCSALTAFSFPRSCRPVGFAAFPLFPLAPWVLLCGDGDEEGFGSCPAGCVSWLGSPPAAPSLPQAWQQQQEQNLLLRRGARRRYQQTPALWGRQLLRFRGLGGSEACRAPWDVPGAPCFGDTMGRVKPFTAMWDSVLQTQGVRL